MSEGLSEESTEAQDQAVVKNEKVLASIKSIAKAVKHLSMGNDAAFIVFVYVANDKPKVYIGGDIDEKLIAQLESLLEVE